MAAEPGWHLGADPAAWSADTKSFRFFLRKRDRERVSCTVTMGALLKTAPMSDVSEAALRRIFDAHRHLIELRAAERLTTGISGQAASPAFCAWHGRAARLPRSRLARLAGLAGPQGGADRPHAMLRRRSGTGMLLAQPVNTAQPGRSPVPMVESEPADRCRRSGGRASHRLRPVCVRAVRAVPGRHIPTRPPGSHWLPVELPLFV